MHQVGVHDTHSLQIRHAAADGTSVTLPNGGAVRLPDHAARALRALIQLRTGQAAGTTASLLDVPQRAISLALNDANTDLNIRVHGRRAERYVHPGRWLRKLGLNIHSLT